MGLCRLRVAGTFLVLSLSIPTDAAASSDADELTALLHAFLSGASTASIDAHDRFWAEDLVYTSSNGTRTDKNGIMDSVRAAQDAAESDDGIDYAAEDVDVRVYGDMAIIAFRLVGTPRRAGGVAVRYFNTGTFARRDGRWRAVAWQATRIPAAGEDPG